MFTLMDDAYHRYASCIQKIQHVFSQPVAERTQLQIAVASKQDSEDLRQVWTVCMFRGFPSKSPNHTKHIIKKSCLPEGL